MGLKVCLICEQEKSLNEFHEDKSKKDGCRPRCKECRKEYSKEYHRKHQTKIIEKAAEWRAKNRISYNKRSSKRKRVKRKNDSLFSFQERISKSLRVVLRNNGLIKKSKTFEMLKFNPQALNEHLSKYLNKFCMICCKKTIALDNSHIDHVKPTSLAKTEQEIIELNQLSNLRLICSTCNIKKGNKYGEKD